MINTNTRSYSAVNAIHDLCLNFTGQAISQTKEQTEEKIKSEYNRIMSKPIISADDIEVIIKYKMLTTGCTRLEADIMFELELDSIDETRKYIAQEVTYKRRTESKDELKHSVDFLKNEYYPNEHGITGLTESDVTEEAKELVAEIADNFIYEGEVYDDYETMTEDEIRAVFYGN